MRGADLKKEGRKIVIIRITEENADMIFRKNPLLLLLCGDTACVDRGEPLGEAVRRLLFAHPSLSFSVISEEERARLFPKDNRPSPLFYFLEQGRICGTISAPDAKSFTDFVNKNLQKAAIY